MSREPSNVILVGFRGCGKTTVGTLLADVLEVPFVDTDAIVTSEAGMTVADIFSSEGEAAFRARESAVVARIVHGAPLVIGLGGGAVLSESNRSALRSAGTTVWLTGRAETLLDRVRCDPASSDSRPPLTDRDPLDEFRLLLAEREPLYREIADLTLDSDRQSPAELANRIADWLEIRTD